MSYNISCHTVFDFYIPLYSYTYIHYICYTMLGPGQDDPDDRPAGLPHGAQGEQGAIHGNVVVL